MPVTVSGRKRTAEDAKLFRQAGFRLTAVAETVMPVSIIEPSRPKPSRRLGLCGNNVAVDPLETADWPDALTYRCPLR
jgi:hypothetical protein